MTHTFTNSQDTISATGEAARADLWWDDLILVLDNWDDKLWRFHKQYILSKTANYTVATGDRNKIIECSHATGFTLSFTAAATLLAGYSVRVRNIGVGNITLDPNGSETIDSAATLILGQGQTIDVYSDGTNLKTRSVSRPTAAITTQTASFTVTGAMSEQWIYANSGSTITVTLPQNSTEDLPIGFQCVIVRQGAGAVTFAKEGSDTLTPSGTPNISAQNIAIYVQKKASGDWRIFGSLS